MRRPVSVRLAVDTNKQRTGWGMSKSLEPKLNILPT